MAIKYVDIPLYDSYFYDMSITLEGISYVLEFTYNSEARLYTLSLYSDEREPIVLGEALVPNYPMFADYAIQGMTGFFVMIPLETVVDTEPYKRYPDKIHKYYTLHYMYEEE